MKRSGTAKSALRLVGKVAFQLELLEDLLGDVEHLGGAQPGLDEQLHLIRKAQETDGISDVGSGQPDVPDQIQQQQRLAGFLCDLKQRGVREVDDQQRAELLGLHSLDPEQLLRKRFQADVPRDVFQGLAGAPLLDTDDVVSGAHEAALVLAVVDAGRLLLGLEPVLDIPEASKDFLYFHGGISMSWITFWRSSSLTTENSIPSLRTRRWASTGSATALMWSGVMTVSPLKKANVRATASR